MAVLQINSEQMKHSDYMRFKVSEPISIGPFMVTEVPWEFDLETTEVFGKRGPWIAQELSRIDWIREIHMENDSLVIVKDPQADFKDLISTVQEIIEAGCQRFLLL
jgi:hypothetical protein